MAFSKYYADYKEDDKSHKLKQLQSRDIVYKVQFFQSGVKVFKIYTW